MRVEIVKKKKYWPANENGSDRKKIEFIHRQMEKRRKKCFHSKQRKCLRFPRQPSFTKSNSNALEIFHIQYMNPHTIATAIIHKNTERLHVIAIPIWFCNAIYNKYGKKI